MHRLFKKLLADAEGTSQSVFAVFVDVRGFSAFSQKVESPDTAEYIKLIFRRIIGEFFPQAKYFKPTGDGLLLVIPFTSKTLQKESRVVVDGALNLHTQFPTLCADNPIINFSVPDKVGIGIARGTACKMHVKNTILDYSGRLLNLAARLMDVARPSGVVIDGDFKIELLEEEVRSKFTEATVYLRGISEETPKKIYYLKDSVIVSHVFKTSLSRERWEVDKWDMKLGELKELEHQLGLELTKKPNSKVNLYVAYPAYKDGKRMKGFRTEKAMPGLEPHKHGTIYRIDYDVKALVADLQKQKMADTEEVHFEIRYQIQ
jgi:class 3 adenylate cyclase